MFTTLVRRAAIKRALRRPSPNRIPLTGPGVSGRNYYSIYFGEENDHWMFLVQSIEVHGVTGLWSTQPGEMGAPSSVPNAMIGRFRIEVVHYHKELEIRYDSALGFLIHQFLHVPTIQVWRERFQRWTFNRAKLVRGDRIRVLRIFFDQTLERHDFRGGYTSVMTILYTARWVHHPDNERLGQYYRILLESLADSGDLTPQDHAYKLAPRGLSTLAEFEEDERKHRDAARLQKAIVVFTAALVVVEIVQAIVTYLA